MVSLAHAESAPRAAHSPRLVRVIDVCRDIPGIPLSQARRYRGILRLQK